MRHYSSVTTEYFEVEDECYASVGGHVEFFVTVCYLVLLLSAEGSSWYDVCGNIEW
jgi:hypothetical protein